MKSPYKAGFGLKVLGLVQGDYRAIYLPSGSHKFVMNKHVFYERTCLALGLSLREKTLYRSLGSMIVHIYTCVYAYNMYVCVYIYMYYIYIYIYIERERDNNLGYNCLLFRPLRGYARSVLLTSEKPAAAIGTQ